MVFSDACGSFTLRLTVSADSFYGNLSIRSVVFYTLLAAFKTKGADASSRSLRLNAEMIDVDIVGAICLRGAVCSLALAHQPGRNSFPWEFGKIIGLLVGSTVAVVFSASSSAFLATEVE